jgi:hypothetical protein
LVSQCPWHWELEGGLLTTLESAFGRRRYCRIAAIILIEIYEVRSRTAIAGRAGGVRVWSRSKELVGT